LVEQYELNTPLPQGPAELPVYVVGRYPESHRDVLEQTLDDVNGWNFIAPFSSLDYGGLPLGEPTTITTPEQAVQRAQAVLRPFLMPDVQPPTVTQAADGGWLVVFNQHVDTYPMYIDRPLAVWVNTKDQVTSVQGRRRPVIEQSVYPLRSAAEAWQLLTQGCGFGVDISGYVPQPPHGAKFEAHTVELAYLVVHANAPREIMQPYYVFHNEDGQGLFVPAVADPFVEWLE